MPISDPREIRRFPAVFAILGVVLSVNAHAAPQSSGSQSLSDVYWQAVASPIRTADDRDADAKRKPMQFLQFAGVRPGMHVLDVAAGAGYTTQLLALVAGKDGKVWAQVPKMGDALKERLAQHPQPNIVPVVRPFDDPAPAGARDLDLVTVIFNYHDIAYMPVDRAKMNRRLFDALKPGGHLVLLDHSAKAGTGASMAKLLHRIDEDLVKKELAQAGFKLQEEVDFLRNPDDPRDLLIFEMSIPVDNFALRFVKP
jgi:predicted methyltransferase